MDEKELKKLKVRALTRFAGQMAARREHAWHMVIQRGE
jgi:hypothetical protein